MGLERYHLVWHQHGEGWIARAESGEKRNGSPRTTIRYAHVDIYPWHIKRIKTKVFVDMQRGHPDHSWHDSIEAAKLHVEAIFALSD
jgi:hypothetical protein